MLENINLKAFRKEAAVYYFENGEEVIYVGSSNDLHRRMSNHRVRIRKGINAERNPTLYEFLQNNSFTVHFAYTGDYRQLEQELIEKYNPKFNSHRANTGLGAFKGREAEYKKEYGEEYYESHKEEILNQKKQYNESHKEEISKRRKQYYNQKCSYNGETLSLAALSTRFRAKGIEHPQIEAKKYLIK